MNTYTCVVFLNTLCEYDIQRFNNVLKPSINFLDNKLLVIPKNVDNVDTSGFTVVLDEHITPVMHQKSSYSKQGLLKLYVSKIIQTTHYLILDSDIYVNKQFGYDDLFTDEKISLFIYDASGHLKQKNPDCCHSTWIHNSLNAFNLTPNDIQQPLLYGVTPGLFITEHVVNMIDYLEKMHPNFVADYMNGDYGCEYSLYYIYVNNKNLYVENNNKKLVQGLWHKTNSLNELDKDYTFWVIQSRADFKINDITSYIANM